MKFAVFILIAATASIQAQEIMRHATTPPKVIHKVEPEYTKEAQDAKVEGVVVVTALVGTDGKASDIKVRKGLGSGLDEKAVECLQGWKFSPGMKDGELVPVMVTVEINFRLLNR